MTHVINQGMAMYWGTSRWSAMEIMVSDCKSKNITKQGLLVGGGGNRCLWLCSGCLYKSHEMHSEQIQHFRLALTKCSSYTYKSKS